MKILIFPAFFYPRIGGSEKVAMHFIQTWQSAGFQVTVVTRQEEGASEFESFNQIPIYRIKLAIIRLHYKMIIRSFSIFLQSFLCFLKIVIKFRPDIIYVHMLSENAAIAGLFSYFYKTRLIISSHGRDTILYDNNIINKVLFRRLLDKAEKIICPSQAHARRFEMLKEYTVNKDKIQILPNGVDLKSFDKNDETFVLSPGKSYIFACGSLFFDKGFDILVKAFRLLAESYPDVDIVIAGDGEERGRLGSLVNVLGLSARVHFLGLIQPERIAPYYRGCLFFVLSSRGEVFPLVALEAMASSKPVIGSKSGGQVELIREGFNGLLFENEDHEVLAEKMRLLIESRDLREHMGLNARVHIEQHYSKELIDRQILELVQTTVF